MKAEITKMIKRHFYNVDGTPEKSASEIEEHVFDFVEWAVRCCAFDMMTGRYIYDDVRYTKSQLYDWWWNNVKNK